MKYRKAVRAFISISLFMVGISWCGLAMSSSLPSSPAVTSPVMPAPKGLNISRSGFEQVSRSDFETLILEVNINGITREEGIDAFLPDGYSDKDVLVPLGQICKALSFAIRANAGDGTASGWFLSEENTFQLNLKTSEVIVKGKLVKTLAGKDAEAQQEDIFVKASLLEEWFGIRISLNLSDLALVIKTDQDLPFQEQWKRLKNSENKVKKYQFEPVKVEEAELVPYQLFSWPSLYLNNSVNFLSSPDNSSYGEQSTVQANFDLLKHESDIVVSGRMEKGENFKISNASASFQKRDPKRQLFGPLQAGKYSFGDVSYPSSPLFAGSRRGAGFLISSDPRLGFRYAGDPDGYVLDGDAPVGWDAELYRNGSFVAFQRISDNGRFVFENIDLINGFNSFQVILYGPEGQKTVITREVLRGAYMLKKGEWEYDGAVGMPNSNFLPLADNSKKDRTPGISAQAFYGVSSFLTVGGNVYSGNEVNENSRDTGVSLTASSSFLGMNVQGHVLAANQGRKAYEISTNARPKGFNISFLHRVFQGFRVEDQEKRSTSEVSLYRNFGTFNWNIILGKNSYLNKMDDISFENIFSASFFKIKFTNDLLKTFSKDESQEEFKGELTAVTDAWDIRLRSSLNYNLANNAQNRFETFVINGQKELDGRSSISAGLSRSFSSSVDTLDLIYRRDFSSFGLDIGASAGTDKNYSLTVGVRAALQPDENNRYHLADPKTGGLASIGARTFTDKNGNGIFDPDIDSLVKDTKFRSSYNGTKESADNSGVAWIRGLGESPTRISIMDETIPDIYMVPKFTFKDLIPRKGVNPIIDFPFSVMGEVEGTVTYNGSGVSGAPVQLIEVAKDGSFNIIEETYTEFDGYYIFSVVKNGNYIIKLSPVGFNDDKTDIKSINSPQFTLATEVDPLQTTNIKVNKDFVALLKTYNADITKYKKLNAPSKATAYIEDMPLEEGDLKEIDTEDVMKILDQKKKRK